MNIRILIFTLVATAFLAACRGQRQQKQDAAVEETVSVQAVPEGDVLKGEVIPIDTVLFRYAYRMRIQEDKIVVFDLHNADYYYHVFTYPDFKYISSFGKRGEGPEEMIFAENVRFAGKNTVWVLDNGKNRMTRYSGIAPGETPKLEETVALDQAFMRALDFDFYDEKTVVIPDYSGENRFNWTKIPTGELVRKSEQIPISNKKLLKESAPAVAQGWRSFISFTPDKRLLVAVTQLGDRIDIYDMKTRRHIGKTGEGEEPKFSVSSEGYGFPAGAVCYHDMQVTEKYIYAIYNGRKLKEVMKEDTYKQGGRLFRVFNHKGEMVKQYVLDRPIMGICVDEANGVLYATDVNADEQIVRYDMDF